MERKSHTVLSQLSVIALCCVGMALPVMAAPPTARLQLQATSRQIAGEANYGGRGADKNAPSSAPQVLPARLDLRPPTAGEFGMASGAPSGAATAAVNRGTEENESHRFLALREQQEDRENAGYTLPGLGGAVQVHPQGLAQGMAARFHREGLPVARLWENHSALVSLGLNQKGKPGLWLVQKTH